MLGLAISADRAGWCNHRNPPYTSNHLQQQDITRGEPTNWEYHVRDFNASYHEKERPGTRVCGGIFTDWSVIARI